MSRRKPPTLTDDLIQESFIPGAGIMPSVSHDTTCNPRKPRQRWQFKFWLNSNDDDDLAIADLIGALKRQRLFQQSIRDGLRLVWDLRAGRTDVLLELFPGIREALPQVSAGETMNAMLRELSEIKAHMNAGGGVMPIPKVAQDVPAARPKLQVIEAPAASADDRAAAFLGSLASSFFDDDDD